ncbi:MAG: hypothetical protein JWR39_728 [Devosia sp.]|nr:hypothetical protein [Devosia sp.]
MRQVFVGRELRRNSLLGGRCSRPATASGPLLLASIPGAGMVAAGTAGAITAPASAGAIIGSTDAGDASCARSGLALKANARAKATFRSHFTLSCPMLLAPPIRMDLLL